MKPFVATVLMLAAICVSARAEFVVSASSCRIPDVDNAYNQARAVFLGEVTEIVETSYKHPARREALRLFTIKFKVERAWKGVFTSTYEVLSAYGEDAGPFPYPLMRKGEKYIVYADPILLKQGAYDQDKTIISGCSRTAFVLDSRTRSVIRLEQQFDRMNGAADVRILDWRYPPLMFSARAME